MSAAALRRPARWTDAARAEAGALLQARSIPLAILLVLTLTLRVFDVGEELYDGVRPFSVLMFFLPLLHWRGRAGRGSLDLAMPVNAVPYELVRLACGAAGATVVLALATGMHAWSYTRAAGIVQGFPAFYPYALVAIGLGNYLLGGAIMLRAAHPGRVLLTVSIVASTVMFATGLWETYTHSTQYAPDGSRTITATTSLTLEAALLRLVLGAAAVGLSVWLGRPGGAVPRVSWRWAGRAAARRGTGTRPGAAALGVPRRPVPLATVAVRQFAVLAPRMATPVVVTALLAVWLGVREVWRGPTFLVSSSVFALFWLEGFFWPLLVWMDERGGLEWDEAQPVDRFRRRLVHAAAGLAWLQVAVHLVLAGCIGGAVVAGTLRSAGEIPGWAWPGLPIAALAVYCLGSFPAVLGDQPVGSSVVCLMILSVASGILSMSATRSPLSPVRLFAPVAWSPLESWSLAAALVWMPIFALVPIAAVRRRMSLDQRGRSP